MGGVNIWDLAGFTKSMSYAGTIAFGLGLLWMILVHFLPMYAPKIACALGFISCLVIAVFAFIIKNTYIHSHLASLQIMAGFVSLLQE